MEPQAIRADDVLRLAHNFRLRAAEAGGTSYHHMMLRTAVDLEELADDMVRRRDCELILPEDGPDQDRAATAL